MGTKECPGKFDCYAKAKPDEPYFTLIARDPTMGAVLMLWNVLRERTCGQDAASEQSTEAHECSIAAIRHAGGLGQEKGRRAHHAVILAKAMIEALHSSEELAELLAENKARLVRTPVLAELEVRLAAAVAESEPKP